MTTQRCATRLSPRHPSRTPRTAHRSYGYGKLKVNASHLEWRWTETVTEDAATGELVRVSPEAAQSDVALFVRA